MLGRARVLRVRYAGINRTDGCALGLVEEADALGALVWINHVDLVALRYGIVGALGLAGTAGNAIFGDLVCHSVFLLCLGDAQGEVPPLPAAATPKAATSRGHYTALAANWQVT
jgi:hypothetical protein